MTTFKNYRTGIITGVLALIIIVSGVSFAEARRGNWSNQATSTRSWSRDFRNFSSSDISSRINELNSIITNRRHHRRGQRTASSTPRVRIYRQHHE